MEPLVEVCGAHLEPIFNWHVEYPAECGGERVRLFIKIEHLAYCLVCLGLESGSGVETMAVLVALEPQLVERLPYGL